MKNVMVKAAVLVLLTFPVGSQAVEVNSSPDKAPSIWIEAEHASVSNFEPGRVLARMNSTTIGASGGEFLSLERTEKHAQSTGLPYYAEYSFQVTVPGPYKLWISASPQDTGWASPLYWKLDDSEFASLQGRATTSSLYGIAPQTYFGWFSAGTRELSAGAHRLRFEVRDFRGMDKKYVTFIDAFFFTQDVNYHPDDINPIYSTQIEWKKLVARDGYDPTVKAIRDNYYVERLKAAREYEGATSPQEIVDKIMLRPLPQKESRQRGPNEFGLHGMEVPFIRAGVNEETIQKNYELLARVGVESFRTAESCWHRLGTNYDNFKELDYQVNSADKYGMTQLFTMGYPPGPFKLSKKGLSAIRPEYWDKYRDYFEKVLTRYKDRGVVRYVELGNEVDAPNPWWMESTPQMYVNEIKLTKEVVSAVLPEAKVVAFGATYSRDPERGGEDGGRRFISKCFDLGIANYCDAYSIHYTWPISQVDFPAFIRREEVRQKAPSKPILNSEESSYGKPSDIIKEFARDFYLYGMPRVDHYLARDWYEAGNLIYSGLFDINWQPKVRLLAYAAAVDGMKGRELVGIAEPTKDVEAYILKKSGKASPVESEYSIIIWRNDKAIRELISTGPQSPVSIQTRVGGLTDVTSAMAWNLDPIKITDGMLELGEHPVILFMSKPPQWKYFSAEQWLGKLGKTENNTEAMVPVQ